MKKGRFSSLCKAAIGGLLLVFFFFFGGGMHAWAHTCIITTQNHVIPIKLMKHFSFSFYSCYSCFCPPVRIPSSHLLLPPPTSLHQKDTTLHKTQMIISGLLPPLPPPPPRTHYSKTKEKQHSNTYLQQVSQVDRCEQTLVVVGECPQRDAWVTHEVELDGV